MNQLIKITEHNGNHVVSARELHNYLESKQDFTTWIKSRLDKYGFVEDVEFTLHKFMEGKVWKHEYILTIDCAKEIAMVEGNEKGKEARQYFIQCEKKIRTGINQISRKELAMMVIQQEEQMELLQIENNKLKPRSEFVDKIFDTSDLIKMSEVAKLLDLSYGRNTLFKELREKGVLFKNSNEPKQELVNKGYFKLKEVTITKPDKSLKIEMQTLVTQKGLAYIAKVLGVIQVKRQIVQYSN